MLPSLHKHQAFHLCIPWSSNFPSSDLFLIIFFNNLVDVYKNMEAENEFWEEISVRWPELNVVPGSTSTEINH